METGRTEAEPLAGDTSLRCNRCGYTLAGIRPVDGSLICPECGMRANVDSSKLRCWNCCYPLRGLSPVGDDYICPECNEQTHKDARVYRMSKRDRLKALAAGPVFLVGLFFATAISGPGGFVAMVLFGGLMMFVWPAMLAGKYVSPECANKVRNRAVLWFGIRYFIYNCLIAGGILGVIYVVLVASLS